jgi:choline kinase
MLMLGTHRVIDWQMKAFALAGIDTLSFVVGHGGEALADHLLTHYPARPITITRNTYFSSRNLDWSAYLALSDRSGDALYYEGDLIVAPELLRLIATHPGDVCAAMDPTVQSARVDTRLMGHGNRVRELIFSEHGNIPHTDSDSLSGEFLCLLKLSNRAREYVAQLLKTQSYKGPMKLYQIFNDLFQRYDSFFVSAAGHPWIEIDNQEDLARAGDVVQQIFGGHSTGD